MEIHPIQYSTTYTMHMNWTNTAEQKKPETKHIAWYTVYKPHWLPLGFVLTIRECENILELSLGSLSWSGFQLHGCVKSQLISVYWVGSLRYVFFFVCILFLSLKKKKGLKRGNKYIKIENGKYSKVPFLQLQVDNFLWKKCEWNLWCFLLHI